MDTHIAAAGQLVKPRHKAAAPADTAECNELSHRPVSFINLHALETSSMYSTVQAAVCTAVCRLLSTASCSASPGGQVRHVFQCHEQQEARNGQQEPQHHHHGRRQHRPVLQGHKKDKKREQLHKV